MVEFQDHESGIAAIDAGGSLQRLPDASHVAAFASGAIRVTLDFPWVESPRTLPPRSSQPVAVHADDGTPVKLLFEATDRGSRPDQVSDISTLPLEVIELKDQMIGFAAI